MKRANLPTVNVATGEQSIHPSKKLHRETDDQPSHYESEIILQSVYPLTRSRSKQLAVGLLAKSEIQKSEVVVAIIESRRESSQGTLNFTIDSWSDFCAKSETFSRWLDDSTNLELVNLVAYVGGSDADIRVSCIPWVNKHALRITSRDIPNGLVMMASTFELLMELKPCVRLLQVELHAKLPILKQKMTYFAQRMYQISEEPAVGNLTKKQILQLDEKFDAGSRLDVELITLGSRVLEAIPQY